MGRKGAECSEASWTVAARSTSAVYWLTCSALYSRSREEEEEKERAGEGSRALGYQTECAVSCISFAKVLKTPLKRLCGISVCESAVCQKSLSTGKPVACGYVCAIEPTPVGVSSQRPEVLLTVNLDYCEEKV